MVVQQRTAERSQPAGSYTSFRQKSLRNLLGRMLEFRQRRIAEKTSAISRRQCMQLWKKISRAPSFHADKNLTENIILIEQDFDRCLQEENKSRLQRWRIRNLQNKYAFAWLRRQTTDGTHIFKNRKDDFPSSTVQEGLDKLKAFWTNIWNRLQLRRSQVRRLFTSPGVSSTGGAPDWPRLWKGGKQLPWIYSGPTSGLLRS